MKILITGARGFIGTNLSAFIRKERPWEIHALRSSILDPQALAAEFSTVNPEIVLHCAAKVGAVRSFQDAAEYHRINVEGTCRLLDACVSHKVRRFIHVSTIEVYGSRPYPTERRLLKPESPYASSKAAADLLTLSFNGPLLETVVVRSTYTYGPHDRPHRMIPFFVGKISRGEPVPLYGDGLQVRDWMHAEDTARGIALASEKGRPGEIYNLGAGNLKTNKEIVRRMLKILGKPETLISHVPDPIGHGRFHAADWSKAGIELGFELGMPFEQTFNQTILGYLPTCVPSTGTPPADPSPLH